MPEPAPKRTPVPIFKEGDRVRFKQSAGPAMAGTFGTVQGDAEPGEEVVVLPDYYDAGLAEYWAAGDLEATDQPAPERTPPDDTTEGEER